jgi:hypothetical protein
MQLEEELGGNLAMVHRCFDDSSRDLMVEKSEYFKRFVQIPSQNSIHDPS